jgi:hypothetical protein
MASHDGKLNEVAGCRLSRGDAGASVHRRRHVASHPPRTERVGSLRPEHEVIESQSAEQGVLPCRCPRSVGCVAWHHLTHRTQRIPASNAGRAQHKAAVSERSSATRTPASGRHARGESRRPQRDHTPQRTGEALGGRGVGRTVGPGPTRERIRMPGMMPGSGMAVLSRAPPGSCTRAAVDTARRTHDTPATGGPESWFWVLDSVHNCTAFSQSAERSRHDRCDSAPH